jgi:uncharacterized membrane protein
LTRNRLSGYIWWRNVRRSGVDYTVSVDIHAPVEKIWSELTDVERWPEWTASIVRVERLEAGPFSLGSRVRVSQPKLPPMVWTVTNYQPGQAFTWMATAGGVTSVAEHRLSPSESQSVTLTLLLRQTGPLAPIAGLLTAGMTRRYVNMEARGLKQRCEMRGNA